MSSLKTYLPFCLMMLFLLCLEAGAQGYMHQAQTIERRLSEAENYFQQNDFEMGAARIVEACSIMRSAPQASAGKNYIQIAAGKIDYIDARLNASMDKNDYDNARKLLAAEQNLLSSVSNWEPQNARWHYQKAKLFQMESRIPMTGVGAQMAQRLGVPYNLHNELNMQPLQNSIQECDRVLGLSDSSFRDAALKMKAQCQSEIQRRNAVKNKFNAEYYRKQPKGIRPGIYDNTSQPSREHYCSKCGGGHESYICPFTHGG